MLQKSESMSACYTAQAVIQSTRGPRLASPGEGTLRLPVPATIAVRPAATSLPMDGERRQWVSGDNGQMKTDRNLSSFPESAKRVRGGGGLIAIGQASCISSPPPSPFLSLTLPGRPGRALVEWRSL